MQVAESSPPLLLEISERKKNLLQRWEDGDLTTYEYQTGLDALYQEERRIYREIDRFNVESTAKFRHRGKEFYLYLLVAFLAGFLISPYLYPKLFGYRNAEECALHNNTRIGYAMCFDLYESKHNN